jgi:hypothetical protein
VLLSSKRPAGYEVVYLLHDAPSLRKRNNYPLVVRNVVDRTLAALMVLLVFRKRKGSVELISPR